MIELAGLTRSYGERVAIEDVSLAIPPGEVLGLLGANGAGKSTLIRATAGLLPPDRGTVRIAGVDLWAKPVAAKANLGYAAEEPAFYEELSASQYLAFVAAARQLDPGAAQERTAELAGRLGLGDRMDGPVRGFSHGMRKKLSFLAAVLHRPQALLCDEALEGFDAEAAVAAKEEVRSLAAAGSAVLFSSHVTETMERLCDRVVILHRGRLARALERADLGARNVELSPLERAFLEIVRR